MKKFAMIVLFLAQGALAKTQTDTGAATLRTVPGQGQVNFEAVGKPSFMKIRGEGEGVRGEVRVGKTIEGTFQFNLETLKTGISLRDRHMKEKYLEIEKFPKAELQIVSVDKFDPALATLQSTPFKGNLVIHGVTKPVIGTAKIEKTAKGYKVQAQFDAKISDHTIGVPSYAGVTVADVVKVEVQTDLM